MNFICKNCSRPCRKLIGKEGKIYCEICFDTRNEYRPVYLHQNFPGAEARGLTYAKAEIIANRIICPEDRTIVIDKRTGRETEY